MQTVALLIILILAVFVIPTSTFERVLDKGKIDGVDTHDLDIFIEKKVKFLHSKIDLKPAIVGLLALEKCVNQLAKGSSDSLESTLSKLLEKRVTRINARIIRLTGKDYLANRDKRSIEFIGDLISDVFGNPGPSDWKKVNSNILALEKALKRVEDNVEINHSDIDMDRHVIELHNKEIKSLSLAVNRNQNELNNLEVEMKGLRTFFEISTLADTLDGLSMALLEIKNDGMRGICSDRALDRDFLIENVQSLEANKAGISPVFGSWEWRNYYKYEMCTLALVKEVVWLTIRIPLVKRSNRLVRTIPTFTLKRAIDRVELYGLKTVLFREKESDQYHLMTQAAFDLCNVLGNTRTCGVRDFKFSASSNVVAVEFMVDRFLLISNKLSSIKVTEKCANTVRDLALELDTVMLTPVNCSYTANSFSIETRESDVEITNEVGIVSIDKLEISKIENFHDNISRIYVEEIANRSSSGAYEKNRKEIKEELNSIDTKHSSSWNMYNLEKWIIIGCIIFCILIALAMKVRSSMVTKRVRTSTFNEIAELRANLRQTEIEFRQETIGLQELSMKCEKAEQSASHSHSVVSNSEGNILKFSSPLNRSQFLQK